MRDRSYAFVVAVIAITACSKPAATPPPAAGAVDFRNPRSPGFAAQAPDSFRARFATTKGNFVIEVQRAWAPLGADRFYNLVRSGFYDGVRFFRVLPGFMAQFGIHGDTAVTSAWRERRIADDPVRRTNIRGMVTFATAGPRARTTQVFINYGNNDRPHGAGFWPLRPNVEGLESVGAACCGVGGGGPRRRRTGQVRLS